MLAHVRARLGEEQLAHGLGVVREVDAASRTELERPAAGGGQQPTACLALASILGSLADVGVVEREQALVEVQWLMHSARLSLADDRRAVSHLSRHRGPGRAAAAAPSRRLLDPAAHRGRLPRVADRRSSPRAPRARTARASAPPLAHSEWRIAAPQNETDPQRVIEGHVWQLQRRRRDERRVAGLERAPETGVRVTVAGHEHMFVYVSRPKDVHRR